MASGNAAASGGVSIPLALGDNWEPPRYGQEFDKGSSRKHYIAYHDYRAYVEV